jgi:hypothetical protein
LPANSGRACTPAQDFLSGYRFSTADVAAVSSANQIRIEVVCGRRSLMDGPAALVSPYNTVGLIGAIDGNPAMRAELRREHFSADEVIGIVIDVDYDAVLYVYPR